jgi:hypothetical protein
MKTKIKPTFSETWSITAQSYNKNETCILSNEEGVSIADISIKRFFQFMKEQNLTMIGNKLVGKFIIGNDRSLYTEEMFNIWKEKFDKRVESEIDKKDLKEGYIYQTVCGSHLLFLGKRYYMTGTIKGDIVKINKPGYDYFCISNYQQDGLFRSNLYTSRLNQRLVKEIGPGTLNIENWETKVLTKSQIWGRYTPNSPVYFHLGTSPIKADNYVIVPEATTSVTNTCIVNETPRQIMCIEDRYSRNSNLGYVYGAELKVEDNIITNFPKGPSVLSKVGTKILSSEIKYCVLKAIPNI